MEETQSTERQNILWSIILELYDEELTARMIGIRLNKPKSFINSCLYEHRGNMFISNSEKVINEYFTYIFRWLENCEKIFDTTNFKGYGQVRFFDFLAKAEKNI